MNEHESRPKICDYEGSNYRTDFWEGRGRDYEDQVERRLLHRLLPKHGKRLLEIGAGFGRLSSEYSMYDQVVLVDYSLSQLQYAQEHLGRSGRYVYVAADVYRLPFRAGVFDGATMIRVIHHMADVEAALRQVRQALVPDAMFLLEHASKRHLKSIVRYALGKQKWNPHDLTPVEFVELNFDFHPEHIRQALTRTGFEIKQRIPVSYFRLPSLKQRVPTGLLVTLDGLMQRTGLLFSPSIFAKTIATGQTPNNVQSASGDGLFVCPESGSDLRREGDVLVSTEGRRWAVRDGIYDFKAPLD